MKKILQKNFNFNLIKLSLILSLFYCILFNSSIILYKIDQFNIYQTSFILDLIKESIYSYLLLSLFFLGLGFNYYTFIIVSTFLFITGAISSYYILCFKITPNLKIIESFFATNIDEVTELLSIKLVIWIILSLTILLYTLKEFNLKKNEQKFLHKILSLLIFSYMIFATILSNNKDKYVKQYLPFIYLSNIYSYVQNNITEKGIIDINQDFKFFDHSSDDIIGVLVIGESARYDHFSINGYERETTPNLKKISNLWSFQAVSCANNTIRSVSCMLSRHDSKNFFSNKIAETSIISVLNNLGFEPLWLSTQTLLKYYSNRSHNIYDEAKAFIIPGGTISLKRNDYDEKLLPFFKAALKDKRFIIVHMSGSHWKYNYRHKEEFTYFRPACNIKGGDPRDCGQKELINSYDNTILYTDFILSELISLLKDKNAFLIYVSDHGESLGENGVFCHGSEEFVKEQYDIPFMIWTSNKFIENNPNFKHHIENNIPKIINHDYVFHSVLGCLNIESAILNKSLSLCPLK